MNIKEYKKYLNKLLRQNKIYVVNSKYNTKNEDIREFLSTRNSINDIIKNYTKDNNIDADELKNPSMKEDFIDYLIRHLDGYGGKEK